MVNLRQKATARESAHHLPFVSMKAKSTVQLVSRYRRSVAPWFRLDPSFINENVPEKADQFTIKRPAHLDARQVDFGIMRRAGDGEQFRGRVFNICTDSVGSDTPQKATSASAPHAPCVKTRYSAPRDEGHV